MPVRTARNLLPIVAAALMMSACLPREAGPPRTPAQPPDVSSVATRVQHDVSAGRFPLSFVENRGQLDPHVGYYAPGQHATTFFTATGLTYAITPGGTLHPMRSEADADYETDASRWILAADFVGANPDAAPVGQDRTDATFNYFRGSEDQWITAVPVYRGVGYANVWPGIDAAYTDRDGHLEYDLTLQPGADLAQIAIAYRGATAARLTESGDVEIEAGASRLVEGVPYAYQNINGQRVTVPASFTLDQDAELGQYTVGFRLGAYDRSQPLVIDPPVVIFAGFVGGSQNDEGMAVAIDSAGNSYLAGQTNAIMAGQTPFPATVGPDLTQNGGSDAFIAKVKADGSGLVYAGYIGGTQGDGGFTITGGMGVAVDSSGSAYVTGKTQSKPADGFPITTGAFDNTLGGTQDAFVAKVKPDGTALQYATYVGGDGNEEGIALAIDSSGNAYVTGVTDLGTNFPVTTGAAQATIGGLEDGYIVKLNAAGSAVLYGSFIGGANNDRGRGVAVDGAGNAYVVGTTSSPAATFPDAIGPSTTLNGGTDAFIAKLAPDGKSFVYAGYVGGTKDEEGLAVAVDKTCTTACQAYIAGKTQSKPDATEKFPAVLGPSLTFGGLDDGFVAKVKGDGTGLVYAGYIGGTQNDTARGIALDGSGFAYVTGDVASTKAQGFPITDNAFDNTLGNTKDGFLAKVKPDGSGFSLVSYLGGDGAGDIGFGIAADATGNAYVSGYTDSTGPSFPTKTGPFLVNTGMLDTWIAKVATATDVSITKTDAPDPATVGQPLTFTLTVSNAGPLAASGVTVTDVLQTGADFVSANASVGSCTFTAGTRTVSCPIGNIAAGANATITIVVTPTQSGTYANTATVALAEDETSTTNNSASSSTTVNAAPTLCSPRPKVGVAVAASGPGRVHVTLTANNLSFGNVLQKVAYGSVLNATVITSQQTGAGGFTVVLPPGTQKYEFDVQRVTAGQGATAQIIVTDACGDWPTFAGLGSAVP